jgi:hypothetical protein
MLEARRLMMARRIRKAQSFSKVQRLQEVAPAQRPEVIVDFHVERGLLFVLLKNIGSSSAWRVVTRFDRAFHGVSGRKNIAEMAVFRLVEFMPPGKQFMQLIDPISVYFNRQEPLQITATVTYLDREGRKYEERMPHDLEVYRDMGGTTGS